MSEILRELALPEDPQLLAALMQDAPTAHRHPDASQHDDHHVRTTAASRREECKREQRNRRGRVEEYRAWAEFLRERGHSWERIEEIISGPSAASNPDREGEVVEALEEASAQDDLIARVRASRGPAEPEEPKNDEEDEEDAEERRSRARREAVLGRSDAGSRGDVDAPDAPVGERHEDAAREFFGDEYDTLVEEFAREI